MSDTKIAIEILQNLANKNQCSICIDHQAFQVEDIVGCMCVKIGAKIDSQYLDILIKILEEGKILDHVRKLGYPDDRL